MVKTSGVRIHAMFQSNATPGNIVFDVLLIDEAFVMSFVNVLTQMR